MEGQQNAKRLATQSAKNGWHSVTNRAGKAYAWLTCGATAEEAKATRKPKIQRAVIMATLR